MNKKGKFIEVVSIRTYEVTEDGRKITKWVVKYLIEFDYPKRDGTMVKQQILAEVHYTEKPNYVVGPLNDPNVYEMQFHFKVRRGKNRNGEDYIVQDITLYKASQSVI